MRKFYLFAFAFLSSTFCTIAAEDFYSDGIRYEILTDSTVSVVHLGNLDNIAPGDNDPKYQGDITIPATVSHEGVDYHVEYIDSYAFCKSDNLFSVTISDGVEYIFDHAFDQCVNLKQINIPNSIVSIDGDAFSGTVWFNELPDGVVYAGSVAYIYKGEMPKDTSIVIKDGIVSISSNAFDGCSNLVSIQIPSSVMTIGSYAFRNCSKLADISVPASVTSIGIHAFYETAWYNSQPDGVIYIGSMLYGHKGYVTEDTLVVRDGIQSINRQSVTSQRIKALIIPEGVTIIGVEAFYNCSRLDSISLPNSLIILSPLAFCQCQSLNSITIPQNVLYLGYGVFEDSENITSVTSTAAVPPLAEPEAFEDAVYRNATLYVPAQSLTAYQTAQTWAKFQNIQPIGTPTQIIKLNANAPTEYYDLSGQKINAPQKGLNIIKTQGKTQKLYIE